MPTFVERLQTACSTTQSLVCVGLDPYPDLLPVPDVAQFNRAIIESTAPWACAYKPNLGFYEALGMDGWRALESTIASIRELAPAAHNHRGRQARRHRPVIRGLRASHVWGLGLRCGNVEPLGRA